MQVQTSLWFLASHLAPSTQGWPTVHSGAHLRVAKSHLSRWSQSLSLRQPTSVHSCSGLPCSPGVQ